jgi:F-type H+-transporting ATPase subunit b
MEERKKTIAEGLAAAEQGEKAQEEAQIAADKVVAEAKTQAAEIVAQAQKRGNDIVDDAKTTAVAEGERLKDAAQADIEAEKNKAKQELRGQVVSIAIAGAEKVLEREIDANAHKDVLDKFVAQL